jgi:hypothetical protein
MPMPPKTPINGAYDYFDILCKTASKYLEIPINFDGYKEVVEKYQNISLTDRDSNWELAKELNAWSEYCSDIANYIQNVFLDAETSKIQVYSEKSITFSDKNVSAGDRKANTDVSVIEARNKRNALKALYDSLLSKKDFLDKAFYQCKNISQQPQQ